MLDIGCLYLVLRRFSGDSMMRQAFISFVCQMRSVATRYKLNWWNKFGPIECPFGAKHCYFDARPYIPAQSCTYLLGNITVCYRNQVDVCHHRFEPSPSRRHICIFNVGYNQMRCAVQPCTTRLPNAYSCRSRPMLPMVCMVQRS